MAKAKVQLYPSPVISEQGCKVGWDYFTSKADAELAAKLSYDEARRLERQGFDFGFCFPGQIEQVSEGKRAGMYRVTTP